MKPLSGATIKLSEKNKDSFLNLVYLPADSGKMNVSFLPVGEFFVKVSHPRYSQILEGQMTIPSGDENPPSFHFTVKNLLEGSVSDSQGMPIPQVLVSYEYVHQGKLHQNSVVATDEGKFRITDVEKNSLDLLTVQAAGFQEKKIQSITLPNQNLHLTLVKK